MTGKAFSAALRPATILLIFCAIAAAQTPVENLRANLTYLASDELEGRGTPSKGLDLAADYVANQFQKANLQPAGPGGTYFQTAKFAEVTSNSEGFVLTLKDGTKQIAVEPNEARVRSLAPLDLNDQPVVKLPASGAIPPVEGMIVAGDAARYTGDLLDLLQSRKPALIILIGKGRPFRPASRPTLEDMETPGAPMIRINKAEAEELLKEQSPLSISVHAAAPAVKRVELRNVAAILPGSDPAMATQYVILSAHYDHLGHGPSGIFHGANDNGSGTVSVIEIARELAAQPKRPKRSILFITFFGEEEGLLGSYYYVRHPLVPLNKTVANVNLEQIGRTDDSTGQRVGAFAFTGPSYTNLPGIMEKAAKADGVNVYLRKEADSFFARSDNYAFAEHGVPDSTIAVAFEYPEYHAIGDTVDKIDFDNLAKVDHAIAAGIERLADESGVPKWSSEKAAAKYREAGIR